MLDVACVYTNQHLGWMPKLNSYGFHGIYICSYVAPDTYANEHSALAARLAAGFCADLASTIVSGYAKNGFALVRIPGSFIKF